jgi:hypothetical protein
MTGLRGLRRVTGGVCLFILTGALLATSASGALTLDLRNGAVGNPAAVEYTGVGQVITLNLWATVTGADAVPTNDGLWKFYTSIRSSNGGLAKGTLAKSGKSGWVVGTAFNLGSGATVGTFVDLDGDGDLDVGSNNSNDALNWMQGRAGVMQATVEYQRTAPYNSWAIANYTFTATGAGPDPHGVTKLYLTPRVSNDNLWNEDGYIWEGEDAYPPFDPINDWTAGSDRMGTPLAGQYVTLYIHATAVAPGGGGTVEALLGENLTLNAGASTGSMNNYQWDLDGDNDWDLTTNNPLTVIPWADLVGKYGLMAGGLYNARLRTAWEESPPVTESTAMFPLHLTPEPATMALLGIGGLLTLIRRRK